MNITDIKFNRIAKRYEEDEKEDEYVNHEFIILINDIIIFEFKILDGEITINNNNVISFEKNHGYFRILNFENIISFENKDYSYGNSIFNINDPTGKYWDFIKKSLKNF